MSLSEELAQVDLDFYGAKEWVKRYRPWYWDTECASHDYGDMSLNPRWKKGERDVYEGERSASGLTENKLFAMKVRSVLNAKTDLMRHRGFPQPFDDLGPPEDYRPEQTFEVDLPEQLTQEEQLEELHLALKEMPVVYRQMVERLYLEGWSFTDIQQDECFSYEAARSYMFRALIWLKAWFAGRGQEISLKAIFPTGPNGVMRESRWPQQLKDSLEARIAKDIEKIYGKDKRNRTEQR